MENAAVSQLDPHHPVLRVLGERAQNGSAPRARTDPHRVALVIEGGGMRGVVSAGMTCALERLGLTESFDLVVGASAGAFNGAALIAGLASHGPVTYAGPLASREFVNPARILRGRPVIDVEYALNYSSPDIDAARHERVLNSPIPLHCIAVDVETARPADLSGMRTRRELWDALLASSRTPWAGGPPVEIARRRYIDGEHGRRDSRGRGPGGGRHARARAPDAPARRATQERVAHRGRPDRAPASAAQSCPGCPLP